MRSINTRIRPTVSIIILILVTFCGQIANALANPQINTDKNVYNYGETIKVNFSNAPGDSRDWICIVPIGSSDTEAGDYKYMPQGVQGVLMYDPPSSPGTYEVRAYYNYSTKGYVVAARHSFLVASTPEYEKATALHMAPRERKINPNNPLEADLPPEKGLVYIFRGPATESSVQKLASDTTGVEAQIMTNGKDIVVMTNASYFPFSVTAGDVKFTTGRIT